MFKQLLQIACLRSPSNFSKYLQSAYRTSAGNSTMDGLLSQLKQTRPMIGVGQMTSSDDKEANLKIATEIINKACRAGAQMVFLPEAFDYIGSSRKQSMEYAEPLNGPTITAYRNIAQAKHVWLSLGGFHQKSPDPNEHRLFNTHVIINDQGDIVSTYNKTHLFDVDIPGKASLSESLYAVPGDQIVPPVPTPVGCVGLAICYDMRFPEMSLALRAQGAEILTYPSAFTIPTGIPHWKPLLQCRAIENQCYVVAAAQVGKHNDKRSSFGYSMVVDPWGSIIAENADRVDVMMVEIDLDLLRARRLNMPVDKHRRRDLYGDVKVTNKAPHADPPSTTVRPDHQSYEFGPHTISTGCVFYQSHLSYSFLSKGPVVPGHTLVCPLRKVARFADLSPAEVSDLYTSVHRISGVIDKHYGGTSLTISMQDGRDAGQSVPHVHVHILARKKGDFSDNDDIYDKLEHHDVKDRKMLTEEEMVKEAQQLKAYFR